MNKFFISYIDSLGNNRNSIFGSMEFVGFEQFASPIYDDHEDWYMDEDY